MTVAATHRRRHLHARAVHAVRFPVRRQPRRSQRRRHDRRAARHHRRAARRHAGADGDQPLARVRGRPRRRHDLRAPAVARLRARARSTTMRTRSRNETAEAVPATAHLFIINPLSGQGMDNLFSTHPNTENRIAALEEMARESGETDRPRAAAAPPRSANAGPWDSPAHARAVGLGAWRPGRDRRRRAGMQSARRPRRRWLRLGLPRVKPPYGFIAAVMHKRHSLDDALAKEFASDAFGPARPRSRSPHRRNRAAPRRRAEGAADGLPREAAAGAARATSGRYCWPVPRSLLFLETPPHAAVGLAVEQARLDPRAKRYDRLVNAVLRRVSREGTAALQDRDRGTPEYPRLAV